MGRRILAIALALLLVTAAPALADVSKWGTHYCQYGQTPFVQSLSSGETTHLPPGSGFMRYYVHGMDVRKTHASGGNGGYWSVTAEVLSSPGTYGGCDNFS